MGDQLRDNGGWAQGGSRGGGEKWASWEHTLKLGPSLEGYLWQL